MISSVIPPFGRPQTGRIIRGQSPFFGVLVFTLVTGASSLRVRRTRAGRRLSFAIGAPFSEPFSASSPHRSAMRDVTHARATIAGDRFLLGRYSGGERRWRMRPCAPSTSFFVSTAR